MLTEIEHETIDCDFKFPKFITGFYLAILLPECLFEEWHTFRKFVFPDSPPLTYDKDFAHDVPHITIKYFGKVGALYMDSVDVFMENNAHTIKNETVQIDGLEIIGETNKNQVLVAKVVCSNGILQLKKKIDDRFPVKNELPFIPHLTLGKISTPDLLYYSQDIVKNFGAIKSKPAKVDQVYSGIKSNDPWLGVFLRI